MPLAFNRCLLVTTLACLTACAGSRSGIPAGTEPTPGSDAALEAIFQARADSARMRFNEADVRFVTGMIHHHAQALVMAEMATTHDASPAIRTLAARTILGQSDEIALMQTWLADRDQPVPDSRGVDSLSHADHTMLGTPGRPAPPAGANDGPGGQTGDGNLDAMPGMLTAEQLDHLGRARGQEFDRLFLLYMIQHHQGAVTMVRELFATDGALQDDALFKLASDIQADQTTEIMRMDRMLAEIPGSRLIP